MFGFVSTVTFLWRSKAFPGQEFGKWMGRNTVSWQVRPACCRVPCKWELRTVVDVEWMEVWSGCQVNVRSKSYIPRRWFSDNSGFQWVDEKLYYSIPVQLQASFWGYAYPGVLPRFQVLMRDMKLFNPLDFKQLLRSVWTEMLLRYMNSFLANDTLANFERGQIGKYWSVLSWGVHLLYEIIACVTEHVFVWTLYDGQCQNLSLFLALLFISTQQTWIVLNTGLSSVSEGMWRLSLSFCISSSWARPTIPAPLSGLRSGLLGELLMLYIPLTSVSQCSLLDTAHSWPSHVTTVHLVFPIPSLFGSQAATRSIWHKLEDTTMGILFHMR